jgi:outer membrane biosynthesis protein TonB
MLLPCPSCRRHVRAASDRCPFCEAPARVAVGVSSSAAGLLLASALATTGCGSAPTATRETMPTTDNRNVAPEPQPEPAHPTEPQPTQPQPTQPQPTQPQPPDDTRVAPAYGGPPVRPAPRPPQSPPPSDGEERPAAAYGGPPVRSPLLPE